MRQTFALLAGATALLAACNNSSTDIAEDQVEDAAEATAAAAGPTPAALGLTETQLLDADLLGTGGTRHQAVAVDETVEAGGTLTVPFAFFEPPPGDGIRVRQVDLTVARSRSGRLTLSVPL